MPLASELLEADHVAGADESMLVSSAGGERFDVLEVLVRAPEHSGDMVLSNMLGLSGCRGFAEDASGHETMVCQEL